VVEYTVPSMDTVTAASPGVAAALGVTQATEVELSSSAVTVPMTTLLLMRVKRQDSVVAERNAAPLITTLRPPPTEP